MANADGGYDGMGLDDRPKLVAYLPALPDFYVVLFFPDQGDGERLIERTPIIGWGMDADGFPWPITPDGVNDGLRDTLPILTPSGRVIEPSMGNHATVADWAAEEQKSFNALQAARLRAAPPPADAQRTLTP